MNNFVDDFYCFIPLRFFGISDEEIDNTESEEEN